MFYVKYNILIRASPPIQMNYAVAKCALGSTHWLEVKKIHICQCLRAGFRALAVEWDGVGGFSETRHGEVRFPDITTHILEKICQYFYWSLHYSSGKETVEFPIEPEITLELMMVSNYLDT